MATKVIKNNLCEDCIVDEGVRELDDVIEFKWMKPERAAALKAEQDALDLAVTNSEPVNVIE